MRNAAAIAAALALGACATTAGGGAEMDEAAAIGIRIAKALCTAAIEAEPARQDGLGQACRLLLGLAPPPATAL